MWKMYRIWLKFPDEQNKFVKYLIDNPPNFSFSFNRYYNIENEDDHIQFRFHTEDSFFVDGYLQHYPKKTLFDWDAHVNTAQTALVASKCALEFMRLNETTSYSTNALVMLEFLHFFFDDLGLYYNQELALYSYGKSFWETWKHLQQSEKNEK